MHRRLRLLSAVLAVLLLSIALPAMADITVIGHYTLATGDTLTRPSYFSARQMRTTLPDGDEVIYDHSARRIALVDHARKLYWEGPLAQADSIATQLRSQRAKALLERATPEQRAKWSEVAASLTDSVRVEATGEARKIAGYPCSEWVLSAEPYLRQERWVARSLAMPDFGPEVEKVVLASMMDPLGRGLMKLVLQARSTDGLTLAGHIRARTVRGDGEMSWEALRVVSGKIEKQAWSVPQGYQRWTPPPAGDGK
jgi:hypothetical protein